MAASKFRVRGLTISCLLMFSVGVFADWSVPLEVGEMEIVENVFFVKKADGSIFSFSVCPGKSWLAIVGSQAFRSQAFSAMLSAQIANRKVRYRFGTTCFGSHLEVTGVRVANY